MTQIPKNILIVDDNQANLILLGFVLRNSKYKIKLISNGVRAIELAKKNKFELIVLDLEMPNINGFETAKAIRKIDAHKLTPIVFYTAVFKSNLKVKLGYSFSIVDYLFKPLNGYETRSKINRILELNAKDGCFRELTKIISKLKFKVEDIPLICIVNEKTDVIEYANYQFEQYVGCSWKHLKEKKFMNYAKNMLTQVVENKNQLKKDIIFDEISEENNNLEWNLTKYKNHIIAISKANTLAY